MQMTTMVLSDGEGGGGPGVKTAKAYGITGGMDDKWCSN
jgi:hypothetical protein